MNNEQSKYLIVLTGPTGVGKTDLSIVLAKHFKAEIFSADSRQFFKELKIGSAMPSKEELQVVKHHFIAFKSVVDNYNVGKYEIDALAALKKYFETNKIAFLVGGSGLYIDVLCNGVGHLPEGNTEIRNKLNNELNEYGIELLQKKLLELDKKSYETIDIQNPKRLLRAIEVCLVSGKPYSEIKITPHTPREFKTIKICLNRDREELYKRINLRVDIMLNTGLIEEAKSLYKYKGFNALKTVGYSEFFGHFDGEYDLIEAIRLIKRNSRRYAKRQLTWFRKDTNYQWFHPENNCKIIRKIEKETL